MEKKVEKKTEKWFTFEVTNDQCPKVTIDTVPIHLVAVSYGWATKDDTFGGTHGAVVSGYISGDTKLRIFKLDFKTALATEI